MTNRQKVIKLRNIIEEIIPYLAIDPLHVTAIQLDYFKFYHAKLDEIVNIDFAESIRLMDKGSYNKILFNSLVEYVDYFGNLLLSRKDKIQLVINDIDRIREEYLLNEYPEIYPSDTKDVKYLNKLNEDLRRDNYNSSIFKNPYSRLEELVRSLKDNIEKFTLHELNNEFVPKHITDKIFELLIDNNAFKQYERNFDEFYNLINIKPNFINFSFKSNTPKQILIRSILGRLDEKNRKTWFNHIIKRLDINKNSFESNQGRAAKVWNKLVADLAHLN